MPGMDGFAFLEEFEMLYKWMPKEIIKVILASSKDAISYLTNFQICYSFKLFRASLVKKG